MISLRTLFPAAIFIILDMASLTKYLPSPPTIMIEPASSAPIDENILCMMLLVSVVK